MARLNDRRFRAVGIIILVVFVISLMLFLSSQTTMRTSVVASHVASVGSKAPDFTLSSLAGDSIKLADLKGKLILVNFWATWCAPCLLEMPVIQEYYEKYPGQFKVLAVNAGESEHSVRNFVDDVGLTISILLDPEGEIQQLFHIKAYPTTYFLDADGIIRFKHVGLLSEAHLEEYLGSVGIGE